MQDVISVKKKKNLGFPNSIEIVWGGGSKRDFFTSFLSRHDAFKLIIKAWSESR